jgi:hypothetical protein
MITGHHTLLPEAATLPGCRLAPLHDARIFF